MEDKCPNCGNFLITRSIKKQLGSGSIDYPVSQMCPKCNWSKDLTGAGDVAAKQDIIEESEIKKEETRVIKPSPPKPQPAKPVKAKTPGKSTPTTGINRILTIALAALVLMAIIWTFSPLGKETEKATEPVPTPVVTPVPDVTQQTPVPEVTPTGNRIFVRLDRDRIFKGAVSNIKPGDEVIWVNDGSYSFTILGNDIPDFGARTLDNGKQTTYIFKKPGTYSFYLEKNKNVNGTIIVGN